MELVTRKGAYHIVLSTCFPYFNLFNGLYTYAFLIGYPWRSHRNQIHSIFSIIALKMFEHSYHCPLVVSPLSGFSHYYSFDIVWVSSPFWSLLYIFHTVHFPQYDPILPAVLWLVLSKAGFMTFPLGTRAVGECSCSWRCNHIIEWCWIELRKSPHMFYLFSWSRSSPLYLDVSTGF